MPETVSVHEVGGTPESEPFAGLDHLNRRSGAEGSRTLDLLNAMASRGCSHRPRPCSTVHEVSSSTAARVVRDGLAPSDRPSSGEAAACLPCRASTTAPI